MLTVKQPANGKTESREHRKRRFQKLHVHRTGHKRGQLTEESYLITDYRINAILKVTKTVKCDAYETRRSVDFVTIGNALFVGELVVCES